MKVESSFTETLYEKEKAALKKELSLKSGF
jgi:hypothetical protein